MRGDALDLRDDEAVGVLRRHRQREVVERQRLALHGDVAGRVGGGAADQRDVDREGLVESHSSPSISISSHQVLGGARVDLAALLARDRRRCRRPTLVSVPARCAAMSRNRCEMHAERQVVGLDAVCPAPVGELRHEGPVAADSRA